MAKSLPYFKFICSEWNDGDITICSMEAQGLFINICSLYWSKEGNLSHTKTMRRYSERYASAFEELIEENIFSIENDKIIIGFLDEQFKERGQLSEQNRLNAQERWNNKRAQSEGSASAKRSNTIEKRKEKKKREEKREEKSKKEGVVFPFDSSDFFTSWISWRSYKKIEHKFNYKSIESEQAALMELNNLSGGVETIAIEIIKKSMAQGWKGFFKLDENGGTGKNKSTDLNINSKETQDWLAGKS